MRKTSKAKQTRFLDQSQYKSLRFPALLGLSYKLANRVVAYHLLTQLRVY